MLIKYFSEIDDTCGLTVKKTVDGIDASNLGAFRYGAVIDVEVIVPRRLGVTEALLKIARDGECDIDIRLTQVQIDETWEKYVCSIDTADLCGQNKNGLFYYGFVFMRGHSALFSDTRNNKDLTLSENSGARFRMLIYSSDYSTPSTFGKGVIYQIFTDRFFKGTGERARSLPIKAGAVINSDWENGIPQYAEQSGAHLKNNVFFGGNLFGVIEKLDYLKSLGVTYIYLCPIFEAYSNHKYDTADYTRVDEMFGGDEALDSLIAAARERGIGIILDGVFNHTGSDSVYFNKYGHFGDGGAYNDPNSPYADWYIFRSYPDDYESWWGIEILPKLNHNCEQCRRFFTADGGIIDRYIKRGVAGWRLDVADELSNEFLDEMRVTVKSSDPNAVIIGEVWENAADKVAYGARRRYFLGDQLDSVMNYPLKNAIVSFCLYGDGEMLYDTLTEIYASYPPEASSKLMNLLGTHDTERILTVLGRDENDGSDENSVLAKKRLDAEQRARGIRLLKLAAAIQFTSYGIPSVYYGDEVGLEGYGDPFCRMPFPWGDIERDYRVEILEYYRRLGAMRSGEEAFDGGSFRVLFHSADSIAYVREKDASKIIVIANKGEPMELDVPCDTLYTDLIHGYEYRESVIVQTDSAVIFKVTELKGQR